MNAKKILLGARIFVLICLMGCGTPKPQTLILRDGSKLTLLAVTYGTNHPCTGIYPGLKDNISEHTESDMLILWVKQENTTNRQRYYQVRLYDQNNTACVRPASSVFDDLEGMTTYPPPPPLKVHTNLSQFQFEAFPRHDKKFYARIKQWDRSIPYPNPNEIDVGQFVIDNPVRGPFPRWKAEPLPITKNDGDLSVTLTRLVFSTPTFWEPRSVVTNDPANLGDLASFRIAEKGKPVTNWQPGGIETCDATGNHTIGYCGIRWTNDEVSAAYADGLWNEPAWKLRVEFYRTSDYDGDELCTITNIPVQAGREAERRISNDYAKPFAKAVMNGVELTFFPARRFTDVGPTGDPQGFIRVMPPRTEVLETNNLRLSLVKVTNESGREIAIEGQHGTFLDAPLHDLGNSKRINVTVAVHRSRFVEFEAKPETK